MPKKHVPSSSKLVPWTEPKVELPQETESGVGWWLYEGTWGTPFVARPKKYDQLTQYKNVVLDPVRGVTITTPQSGALLIGPYLNFAQVRDIWAEVYVSAAWHPNTYRACNHRDWLGRCDGWDTRYYDFGYTVDLVSELGKRVLGYLKIQNQINQSSNPPIRFHVEYSGPLTALEIRLYDLLGTPDVTMTVDGTALFITYYGLENETGH